MQTSSVEVNGNRQPIYLQVYLNEDHCHTIFQRFLYDHTKAIRSYYCCCVYDPM